MHVINETADILNCCLKKLPLQWLYLNRSSFFHEIIVVLLSFFQGSGNYSVDAQVVDGEWVGFYLMVCIALHNYSFHAKIKLLCQLLNI